MMRGNQKDMQQWGLRISTSAGAEGGGRGGGVYSSSWVELWPRQTQHPHDGVFLLFKLVFTVCVCVCVSVSDTNYKFNK